MTRPVFRKVLIANRGEIARRIVRTLRRMGVRFAAVARPEDAAAGPALPGAIAAPALHRPSADTGSAILGRDDAGPVPVVYRRQGDDTLLVEYGPMTLDIGLCLRVHLLAEAVAGARLAARRHRPDAGHTLPAGPLRRRRPLPPAPPRRAPGDRGGVAAGRGRDGPQPDDPPAALLERPAGRTCHAQVPGARAPERPLVPLEHRVHPPHQRP